MIFVGFVSFGFSGFGCGHWGTCIIGLREGSLCLCLQYGFDAFVYFLLCCRCWRCGLMLAGRFGWG